MPVVIVSVVILALASSVAAFFIWRKIKRDKLGRTGNSMHTTATKPEEENVELNEELLVRYSRSLVTFVIKCIITRIFMKNEH